MPGGGSQPGRSGSVLDGLLPDTLRIKIVRIRRPVVVSPVVKPHAELAGGAVGYMAVPAHLSSERCVYMSTISNSEAIAAWSTMPTDAIEAYDDQGDFPKRHLMNGNLLRMLGPVDGRKVLDAGSGEGYLSRLLAERGAEVVGVEPAAALLARAQKIEQERRQGIRFEQADLSTLPEVGQPFDAVVCSMVLLAIPAWQSAMAACVGALKPGGRFVFSITHPAFENLYPTWRDHGRYQLDRYLDEYEMPEGCAPDFHRPLSAYINEVVSLGCRVTELCEPRLDPQVARDSGIEAIESYVALPNFLIVSAERDR
jgi:2-polyprenyl-3-methyl-5-hydroxy-6-metoxy-1,4-benzoquinol methylase